jgi:hypothetical protein
MSSAAAIAVEVNPIVTAIESTTASVSRLMRVRELWESSRKSQLEIGRLLYEERAERLSVGGRGVYEGFHQWLRDAGIPKTSAYRRIAEYEISIGERAEEDKFDKPTPATKPVPSGTTFEPANADVVQSNPNSPARSRVTVEEGKVFGNLIAHKKVTTAPYDRSAVWLVENTKTDKAELWRACDLTHIERDGKKNNDIWHWGYRDSRFMVGHGPEKMLEAAQDGLTDIKAGTFDGAVFEERLDKIYFDAREFMFLDLHNAQSPKTPSLEVLAQCIRRFGDCSISQSKGVHHLEMKLIGLAPERLAVALEAFNAALGSCDEACGETYNDGGAQ